MSISVKKVFVFGLFMLLIGTACSDTNGANGIADKPVDISIAERNLQRSIEIVNNAVSCYFTGDGMAMANYYNPFTKKRTEEKGSIWKYTSAIEAVNAVLKSLQLLKESGVGELYDSYYEQYRSLLDNLYDNADFYLGTFQLTSYTRTNEWTVYGVNRGASKGSAKVEGVENVYDDQMWLIRELLESYHLTDKTDYLDKAEYLMEYVLDGWDCTLDANGQEIGGITWGPGYATKHACSNGPLISSLVWLHEIYLGQDNEITHYYIDPTDKKTRKTIQVKKSEYYLRFAEKVYQWQKKYLLRSDGVYDDMMGGCSPGKPETEIIQGIPYKKGITCRDKVGPAYTYNSGTMLSGASDLYRITGKNNYLIDARNLSDASFRYFAKKDATKEGYYTYDISGYRNWFNGVLMRAYVDVYPFYNQAKAYVESFQRNLDYGYENFLYDHMLPVNLLVGWSRDNNNNKVEGMFTFTFAAEYAVLARFEIEK